MKLRLESLVKEAKLSLIEREGKVTRSEVYLTNLENNEQVQLCMTPEKIRVRTEENFRTFDIIERGEVKLPKGEELTQIDWDGILPGARLLMYPFLTHVAWEQPIEIIKVFKRWREEGASNPQEIMHTIKENLADVADRVGAWLAKSIDNINQNQPLEA